MNLFEGEVTCHLIEIEFQGISIVLTSDDQINYTLMYSRSDEPIKYDQRLELGKKISRGIHANESYTEKLFLVVYKDRAGSAGEFDQSPRSKRRLRKSKRPRPASARKAATTADRG